MDDARAATVRHEERWNWRGGGARGRKRSQQPRLEILDPVCVSPPEGGQLMRRPPQF